MWSVVARSSLAKRLASFSLVGVANTLLGAAVILLAVALGAPPLAANVAGYAAGLLLSYTLNARYTFRGRSRDAISAQRFLAAFLLAFCLNMAAVIAASALPLPKWLASIAGVPVYMIASFLLCEYWVFSRTGRHAGEPDDDGIHHH